jgi:ABC-type uncharacterized transport system permease subunit
MRVKEPTRVTPDRADLPQATTVDAGQRRTVSWPRPSQAIQAVILSTAIAAGVGLLLAMASGASAGDTINALWNGMTGTPYAIGTSINRVAILVLVGLGFVIADRVGLVNVGGEGQLAMGALGATAVGTTVGTSMAQPIALPLILLAGAAAGGAFAALAGWLKVRRDTSEVITTLLLNFIGVGLVSLAVHQTALLRQPTTSAATLPQSEPMPVSAHLPLIGGVASPATGAIIVAGLVTLLAFIVLGATATGLRLRAVAATPAAAFRLGVPVDRLRLRAMTASGACAGLAGAMLVATAPFVLTDGITSGLGFTGLVVGLLGRGTLLGTFAAAVALGFLSTGGISLQLQAQVPASTVAIATSILVLCLAGAARSMKGGAR